MTFEFPQSFGPSGGGAYNNVLHLHGIYQARSTTPYTVPLTAGKGGGGAQPGLFQNATLDNTAGPSYDQIKDDQLEMFISLHKTLELIWQYGTCKPLTTDLVVGNRIARPVVGVNPHDFLLPGQ